MKTSFPTRYQLLLRTADLSSAENIWDVVQVLNSGGPAFRPICLRLPGGVEEERHIAGLRDVDTILNDPRIRSIGPRGLYISFILIAESGIWYYFSIEEGKGSEFEIEFMPGIRFETLISPGELYQLFRRCVGGFRPYWGCVKDIANSDRRRGTTDPTRKYSAKALGAKFPIVLLDERQMPQMIHWLNFFGAVFVARLGGKRPLLECPVWRTEETEKPEGVILALQQEPFDDANCSHRTKQLEIEQYLNLAEKQAPYMIR